MKDSVAMPSLVEKMITLRLLVGFLGERRQANWWDCGFLDPTGRRFLETTFPRTALSAALRSTSEAARIVHDARIGRIGVFHLFRFPIDKEDRVEAHVVEQTGSGAPDYLESREAALVELARLAESRIAAPQGPVQVGVEKKILTPTSISELAAHYHSAFSAGIQCFPYFTADMNVRH
jgi:hypothetical protein